MNYVAVHDESSIRPERLALLSATWRARPRGQWYLRQMLGSSNIDAGPAMAFMTGNLSYQIEHQLYRICRATGWPRSRCGCARCATDTTCLTPRVRCWCSTARRVAQSPSCRCRTSTGPTRPTTPRKTRSEKMFAELEPASVGTDPATGRRRGLKTAMATVRQWRRRNGLRR